MTNIPFERKSKIDTDKDTYLDANGNYVYTHMVRRTNGQWEREIIDIVPLTSENTECIIVLEENDHKTALAERYDAENADYHFIAKKNTDQGDPLDKIPGNISTGVACQAKRKKVTRKTQKTALIHPIYGNQSGFSYVI